MLALSPLFLASSLISGALAASFTVEVGNGGLTFNPPTVNAAQGDDITFVFYPKNHTLTQSTLAAPCTAVPGGGNSGFMPVAVGSTDRPSKRIVVPAGGVPLWFYCAQGNHCQSGMVFSINPKSAEQQAQFVANAKAFVPGQAPPPATSTPPTETPLPTATISDPVASPTSTTPTTPPATGRVLDVIVGQGGLTFTPDRLDAALGDTINFKFVAGAHTATQSTFSQPCSPLAGGFDTKSQPATAAAPVNQTFVVNDVSKPLWFYCATGAHCRAGMVFSLNAPATGNTADAFKAAAMGGAVGGSVSGTNTGSVSGSGSQTAAGPEQTADSARSLVGGVSSLLVAAVLAGLLL